MSFDRIAIDELALNINPLQTGGRANSATRRAAARFSDGYSVCDRCAGVLHDIEKPDIKSFAVELADFLGLDRAGVTMGAREGKFAIFHTLAEPGRGVVLDGNAHYSTYVAAQRAGLEVFKSTNTGAPEYRVTPESFAETLEYCKSRTGKPAAAALLTHVDGDYGNLNDAVAFSKVCRDAGVPFVLNCAYSAGRMPIDCRALGVDFMVGSGHKSFAVGGPVGVMGANGEWADRLFRTSLTHPNKNIEMLGCTARGANIVSFMAALPGVVERVKRWDSEVAKARRFVEAMEDIGEIHQVGERPKNHDLIRFETPLFHRIAENNRKRGYFLSSALGERGVTGLKPGQTRWFKMSTYGFTDEQVDYLIESFAEVARM